MVTGRIWTKKKEQPNVPLSKYSLGSVEFSSLGTRLDISGESDLKVPGTEGGHLGERKFIFFLCRLLDANPSQVERGSIQPDRPNEEQLATPASAKTVPPSPGGRLMGNERAFPYHFNSPGGGGFKPRIEARVNRFESKPRRNLITPQDTMPYLEVRRSSVGNYYTRNISSGGR